MSGQARDVSRRARPVDATVRKLICDGENPVNRLPGSGDEVPRTEVAVADLTEENAIEDVIAYPAGLDAGGARKWRGVRAGKEHP